MITVCVNPMCEKGGGAGEFIQWTGTLEAGSYSVAVGSGGSGGAANTYDYSNDPPTPVPSYPGSSGGISSISKSGDPSFSIQANGGGGGGDFNRAPGEINVLVTCSLWANYINSCVYACFSW